jgi:hypothetical protein
MTFGDCGSVSYLHDVAEAGILKKGGCSDGDAMGFFIIAFCAPMTHVVSRLFARSC